MVDHRDPAQETYRIADFGVIRGSDGANIMGPDRTNPDWVAFDEWKNAGGIPTEGPVKPPLEEVRANKLWELEAACDGEILAGFPSDALGDLHHYDSDIVDQINLLGAVMLGQPTPHKCRKDGEADKQWHTHTAAQMRKVVADGATHRRGILQKFTNLKQSVKAMTDAAQIESVVW